MGTNVGAIWSGLNQRLRKRRWPFFVLGLLVISLPSILWMWIRPTSSLEPGEIVILSGADDSVEQQREQLLEQWNSQHPQNRAVIRPASDNADEQHSAMVSDAQSGNSTVDVYNLDVTWVTEFADARYIRPLDSVDTTPFLDKPLQTCRVDGKLYALPFNTDAGLLYYRTDITTVGSTQGPPLPPDSAAMLDALKAHPELKAGYAMQLGDYEGLTVNALESIWAAGGDVERNGHITIDSEEVEVALRQLARGLRAPTGSPGVWPGSLSGPDGEGGMEKDSTKAFADGSVVFMRNWPVAYGQLLHEPDRAASPSDISKKFDVTLLPGPSVLGGQNLAIAGHSRKPRAAQALIEFLTSASSQKQLFRDGALPATRVDAYSDGLVRDKQPYAPILLRALNAAKTRPITPHYPLFSSVFQEIVRYALDHDGALPPDATRRLTNARVGRLE